MRIHFLKMLSSGLSGRKFDSWGYQLRDSHLDATQTDIYLDLWLFSDMAKEIHIPQF
jgi:hypothetical protein